VTPEIASKKVATFQTNTHTHTQTVFYSLSLSLSLSYKYFSKELREKEASKVTEHKKQQKSMFEKPVAYTVDSFVFKMFE
jgi:hypothetical protein